MSQQKVLTLPPVGVEDEEWRTRAACRGHPDPDPIWNPNRPEQAAEGKRICSICPVQARCAEYALTRREPHGTWGGMTEWERDYVLTGRYRHLRR